MMKRVRHKGRGEGGREREKGRREERRGKIPVV